MNADTNIYLYYDSYIQSHKFTFQLHFPESQDVTLVVRGRSDNGQTIEIRQETTVSSEETQIVRLRIGDLGLGKYVKFFDTNNVMNNVHSMLLLVLELMFWCSYFRYSLTARGQFPIAFDQVQDLNYVHKGYSVFIQTDKSVYR